MDTTSQTASGQTEMRVLVRDARALLRAAAMLTGDQAVSLRARGLGLLDTALARMQQTRGYVVARGRSAAQSADGYVRARPWQTVALAAAAGVLLGVIFRRR